MDSIFDDLSIRFIFPLTDFTIKSRERLYFVLEECHWFYIDFILHKKTEVRYKLKDFCSAILKHNNMEEKVGDFNNFIRYKNKIPVYGAALLTSDFTHVLLVRGTSKGFTFPKGKRNYNETEKECAIREVMEEVGYDITNSITDFFIKTERGHIYLVPYVNKDHNFKTQTRNEIREIRWFLIQEIETHENVSISFVKAHLNNLIEKIEDLEKRISDDLEKKTSDDLEKRISDELEKRIGDDFSFDYISKILNRLFK